MDSKLNVAVIGLIAGLSLGVTACGGGGGGSPSNDNPAASASPNPATTPTPAPSQSPAPSTTPTPAADNGAAAALQSLQGAWFTACVEDGNGGSQRTRFVFENDRQTVFEDEFSDPACATQVRRKASISYGAIITVGGTVTTSGGLEARKLDVEFDPDENGDVEFLLTLFRVDQDGQRLLVGDSNSAKDADGRDTALLLNIPFSTGTPPPPQVQENTPPNVNAGSDQSVDEGATVNLVGTATDAEDAPNPPNVLWTQQSGVSVILLNETTLTPSFEAPQVDGPELLVFRLTATDSEGESASADVRVSVDDSPLNCSGGDGNNSFDCAEPIGDPTPQNGVRYDGSVDGSADDSVDYLKFNLANTPIVLDLQVGATNFSPICHLYLPGQVQPIALSSCAYSNSDGAPAGTYHLSIEVSAPSQAGDYEVFIDVF